VRTRSRRRPGRLSVSLSTKSRRAGSTGDDQRP
jgi:hypothetical protein